MLNEELLHFIWKHRFLPPKQLKTLTNLPLEVIDPGLHNTDAGPDFINAKIKIGKTLWVGNVELHIRAADWYVHGHNRNPVYDTVILHVALESDTHVRNSLGESIPQLVISIPQSLQDRYKDLKLSRELIPCHSILSQLKPLETHGWLERLLVERLEDRYSRLYGYYLGTQYDWTSTFFIALARSFGFGKNSESFERWAKNLPFHHIKKHISNLFELETIFFGTAGLLNKESMPAHFWHKTVEGEQYFNALCQEYTYLSYKYELKEVPYFMWKYLRTRPYNFPHVRIAQLAALYQLLYYKVTDLLNGNLSFSREVKELKFTSYWNSHYCFSSPEENQLFKLTESSVQLLELNCIIPLIYAMGKYKGEEDQMQIAVDKIGQLKPENNKIIRTWVESGMRVRNAADTQAILQLQANYCNKKDCLRCRFGMEYLRSK